jgi:hypothetical protein
MRFADGFVLFAGSLESRYKAKGQQEAFRLEPSPGVHPRSLITVGYGGPEGRQGLARSRQKWPFSAAVNNTHRHRILRRVRAHAAPLLWSCICGGIARAGGVPHRFSGARRLGGEQFGYDKLEFGQQLFRQ